MVWNYRNADSSLSFNKLDRRRRRRDLLTTRSTCHGEIFFLSPVFGTKLRREVPLFLEIPEFSYNTLYRISGKKLPRQNPARLVASSRFDTVRLMKDRQTDGRTDGRTQDDSKYCASIASPGKKASNRKNL